MKNKFKPGDVFYHSCALVKIEIISISNDGSITVGLTDLIELGWIAKPEDLRDLQTELEFENEK